MAIVAASIQKKAKPFLNKLNSIDVIKSKEDYELAASNLRKLKDILNVALQEEKEFREPLKQLDKKITEHFKPFKDDVRSVEETVKELMQGFLEMADKETKKLEQDFSSGKIKKGITLMDKKSKFEGIGNTRKVWQAVPIDESKTPREYLIPDEQLISKALKEGKKVKGWIWKQVKQITI